MTRQRVPGPANGPFGLRHIYSLNTRPLAFYERLGGYGDVAAFRMGSLWSYLLNSPDLIHEVLRDTGTRFRKLPRTMRALSRGLGQGLLVSDGAEWLAARRLVQPSFNKNSLQAIVSDVTACGEAMLERWTHKAGAELLTEMNRVTADVSARVLFGVELEEEALRIGEAARELGTAWDHAVRQVIVPPKWLPLPRHRRERQSIEYLRGLVTRIIRQRREAGLIEQDLLSRLVAASDQEPGDRETNDQRLIDQVLTLLVAGYHASTVTLCWTFYLLARHPQIERQIVEEIDRELGGQRPTLASLQRLELTQRVLKESMRLYPSAWEMFPRQAVEATQLGDWQIARGAWLFLSPYVTHRDERFFSRPLRFDPGRWSPGRVEAIDPHAYFPFGGGRHVCVGREMAMVQNTLLLALVLRQYHVRFLQREHVPHHKPPMALVPRDPMRVVLQRRSTREALCGEQPAELSYGS